MNQASYRAGEGPVRILCISPVFAPTADSEAFCGAKMVRALIETGAEVKVFWSSNFWPTSRDESPLWRDVAAIALDVPTPVEKERWASLSSAVRYQVRYYTRWVGTVVRQAQRLHRERPFDFVYSRSLPMDAHVAGYWCSRRLGIPWVANINDPWDYHLFPGRPLGRKGPMHRILSKMWLRRTLTRADLVTFPSEKLHAYNSALAGVDGRVEIIPHVGHSVTDKSLDAASGGQAQFRLVHAGKLGSSEITRRHTEALLTGLKRFLNAFPESRPITKLILVGPKDEETQAWIESVQLGPFVDSVGRVQYEESLRYISSASVCLLVEADIREGIFLPSKLADYLVARKPVLAFSPAVGVVADLARQGGGIVRVDPGDAGAVEKAIATFYSDFRRGSLHARAPDEALVDQFSPPTVARRFLAALSQLGGVVGLKASRTLESINCNRCGASP